MMGRAGKISSATAGASTSDLIRPSSEHHPSCNKSPRLRLWRVDRTHQHDRVTMRSARCLRLASHSSLLSLSKPSASAPFPRSCCCSTTTAAASGSIRASKYQVRAFTAGRAACDKPRSRFADVEDEDMSPFKRHRVETIEAHQNLEEPLYPETHPRLEDSPYRKSVPEFLNSFHKELSQQPVTLMGRVRSKRQVAKKLVFLDIENEFQRAQVMLNCAKCVPERQGASQKFGLFTELIQVGDHVSVTGMATRTKAGEPTLEATQLPELLSPSMEQIPETLTDPEKRMQQRHLDMLVNKEVIDVLRLRAEITRHMRDHFHSKQFLEFQTPILAENAGGAVARPFVTKANEFKDKELALRVAPELWLKRLVVGGVDKVFEIGPAFRNEGIDGTHNPEFTMCEFYSAYTNLANLIEHTEELLSSLAQHSQQLISTQLTALPPIDLSRFVRPFKQVEFIPELEAALGCRLPNLSSEDALPGLVTLLKLQGIRVPGEMPDSLPKLLDKLAAIYLEPASFTEPVFITHHPACMSPLAKSFMCEATYQLVSARAELFVGGRELANMYEEENNPKEQKRKLDAHRKLVNKDDGEVGFEDPDDSPAATENPESEVFEDADPDESEEIEYDDDGDAAPLDQSFIKVLDHGLPPTGGWGCGVERLVMLFSGANRISDCLSFGTLRNVVGLSADENRKIREAAAAESKEKAKPSSS